MTAGEPAATPASPPPPPAPRLPEHARRDLLNALGIRIPHEPLTPRYRFGMSLLAGALLALSGGFFCLVGFIAWLSIWHFVNAATSMPVGPFWLFHFPMALAGTLVVVFLVKPVFFRAANEKSRALTLTREQEPLLFDYVEGLCAAAGAPAPATIEVDCTPNAHARFGGGVTGFLRRRLVLRIGLPLVGGMPLRHFTGVLAHEIGHFAQRGGMTAQHLIRALNAFFARVVFQRDKIDVLVYRLRQRRDIAQLPYWIAAAFIAPTRGVLWIFLVVGESLSKTVLRNMEYNADRLEARVYGPEAFEPVMQSLAYLATAHHRALQQLERSWHDRRLPDDFSRLVVAEAASLRTEEPGLIAHFEKLRTGWFDTHPCHTDRIGNIQRLPSDPLRIPEIESRWLFADFEGTSRLATREMYAGALKDQAARATLVPAGQLADEFSRQRRRYQTLAEYFCGVVMIDAPIFPADNADVPLPDAAGAIDELVETRETLRGQSVGLAKLIRELHEARQHERVAAGNRELAQMFAFNPRAASVRRKAEKALRKHTATIVRCTERSRAFAAAGERRFTLALQLGCTPLVIERTGDTETAAQVAAYFPLARTLHRLVPEILQLVRNTVLVQVYLSAYNAQQPYGPLVNRIIETGKEMRAALSRIQAALDAHPYPFEHAQGGIRAGAFLADIPLPDQNDPGGLVGYSQGCLDRLQALSFRVLSQLSEAAARVEAGLGFEPLPAPPAESDIPKTDRATWKWWASYGARAIAGVIVLGAFAWYSLHPPVFPFDMQTETGRGTGQPAAFSFSLQHMNRYSRAAYETWTPAPGSNETAPPGAPLIYPGGAGPPRPALQLFPVPPIR